MLIASPLAGRYADRNGSRSLASIGMLGMALGMALMTTLQRDTSYFWPGLVSADHRHRLGHVPIPEHGPR